jgi:predicted outer membrane protein
MQIGKGVKQMVDTGSEAMRKEIGSFSQRLRALKEDLREGGKLSDKNQALLDQIQQHKERLEAKFSNAETAGNWGFIREEFVKDWNSLVVDATMLENRLYE